MASFHAEFLFYLFYFLLSRFVLLFVCVAWFGGTERRKKTKKENIAFLAFSWIEGFYFFFLLLLVVALYPILFLFIQSIYDNLLLDIFFYFHCFSLVPSVLAVVNMYSALLRERYIYEVLRRLNNRRPIP